MILYIGLKFIYLNGPVHTILEIHEWESASGQRGYVKVIGEETSNGLRYISIPIKSLTHEYCVEYNFLEIENNEI